MARRIWSSSMWAFAGALLAVSLWRLVPVCRDQLAAPFDLISEGPHTCTVKAIRAGYDIYGRQSFLDLPFFMTPYTPLYHVVVAALPQDPANPFFTGRLVAMLFMIAAAASLLVVAGRGHRAMAAIAIAVFFLIHSVTGNTAYLRSDSMALCFSVWAVVLAARARSTRAVVATGILCALAVAAKQSFLAAPVVCFLYFVLRSRKDAAVLAVAGATSGAALALAAWAYWGTDFWIAVTIPMTDYPRDIESFFHHWHMMFAQPVFLVLIAAAVVVTLAAMIGDRRGLFTTPFFPYLIITWAFQTWVMTGIGAENHNLIEPVLATLLWIVVGPRTMQETLGTRAAWSVGLAVLALAVARELRNVNPSSYSYTSPEKTARYVRRAVFAHYELKVHGTEVNVLTRRRSSASLP
jgi:hypothetical protein